MIKSSWSIWKQKLGLTCLVLPSQLVPPSPSPPSPPLTVCTSLSSVSGSLLLPCELVHQYPFLLSHFSYVQLCVTP